MSPLANRYLRYLQLLLLGLALPGVITSLSYVFLVVPNERVMGAVQRIFYFHVGSAIACYIGFAIVLGGSLGYLATRQRVWDIIAHAGAEVSFVFCSIVLVTGMIWGQVAWNTPFRWEPRLVSFLLLWMIACGYLILRTFGDRAKVPPHAAVLGIIGAVTVPIVVYSVKLLPHVAQLHPEVVEHRGLHHPDYWTAFYLSVTSMIALLSMLVVFRIRLGLIEHQLEEHHG